MLKIILPEMTTKTGVSRVNEHENYIPCKRQKRDDSEKNTNSNINFRSRLELPSSSREEEYEQDYASSENLGSRGLFCGDEGECSYQSTSRNENHPRSQKCQERAREDKVHPPLRYRAMEEISKNQNLNEAMTEIIIKKPRYVALLNSEEIRLDLFKLVIDSLLVILKAENRPTESNEIIMKTYKKILQCHFPQFITNLFIEVDISALLSKVLYIFKVMLQKMSNEVVSLLTTSLYWINRKKDKWNLSKDVLKDLEQVETLHESLLPKPQSKHDQDNEHPPNDFRKLSIVPTSEDFKLTQKPFLRANVTQKPFSDVEHYLDVQFRLLREDCFLPLRDSINGMRMLGRKMKSKKEVKQEISFVFNAVRILNPVCSRHGGVFAIQLDIRRCNLQNVKWDRWKKLKYGSLVCLSNDWFENELLFATVESRDDVKYGILDLRFESFEQEKMRQFIADETVFKMIENDEAFFEAYKHNLEALQRMTDDKFPFKTQIVHCNKEIEPPEYLMSLASKQGHSNAGSSSAAEFISEDNEHSFISSMKCRSSFTLTSSDGESDDGSYSTDRSSNTSDSCTQDQSFGNTNACLDFSSISDDYILQWMDFDISKVAALELNQWPTKEMLGLDESQYRACQLALTKRFALIQGTGTGKTYVGLKIAQVLLDNIEALNDGKPSPILMVSYTNHALDQFLMGIKTREGNINYRL